MNTEPGKVDPRVAEMVEKHQEQLALAIKEMAGHAERIVEEAIAQLDEGPLTAREKIVIGAVSALLAQTAFQTTITAVLAVGDAIEEGLSEVLGKSEGA